MFRILVTVRATSLQHYLDYVFDTREEADLVAYDYSRWFPKNSYVAVEA